MYWILFVMGTLAAIVVALVAGGLATPRTYVVSRAMTVSASAESTWRTIRDVDRYAEWRPELDDSVASVGDEGPEWRESMRGSSVRFGIVTDEPPVRFVARVLDDDVPFAGEWTWEVAPVARTAAGATGAGARVTITERGEIGNPVSRFIAAHMRGHDRSIDAYLRALAIRVGDATARIEDARR